MTCSSAVPEISRVKRTQREHMMQRSVNSVTLSPMYGLFGGVFFSSIIRLCGSAEVVAEVLQHALAGLVADGAIERMIEQQIPSSVCAWASLALLAVGDDDGAVLGRRLAAGHDLGLHGDGAVGLAFADLDQAHPATGDDGQRRVPAVVRDEHAAPSGPPG